MKYTNIFKNGVEICNRHNSEVGDILREVNWILENCRIENIISLPNQTITIFTQDLCEGFVNNFVVIRGY